MDIRIRYPFLLSVCLLAVLFWDGTGILRCSLAAVLLHECGHTLLYKLLLHRRPTLRIGLGGIALHWHTAGVSVSRQAAILLAGPAVNFLAALLFVFFCKRNFRLSIMFLAGANVLLGAFNLLPMGFLDGGRLLELLLLPLLPAGYSQTVLRVCETGCLLLLLAFLLISTTDWTVRIALLFFLGYYCCKSFCAKN